MYFYFVRIYILSRTITARVKNIDNENVSYIFDQYNLNMINVIFEQKRVILFRLSYPDPFAAILHV